MKVRGSEDSSNKSIRAPWNLLTVFVFLMVLSVLGKIQKEDRWGTEAQRLSD